MWDIKIKLSDDDGVGIYVSVLVGSWLSCATQPAFEFSTPKKKDVFMIVN